MVPTGFSVTECDSVLSCLPFQVEWCMRRSRMPTPFSRPELKRCWSSGGGPMLACRGAEWIDSLSPFIEGLVPEAE